VKKRLSHIALLLFSAFLLLPFLSMTLMQVAHWYLKETAMERSRHHQLITISLPAARAVWQKKEKELHLDGRFFDVTYYSVSGETLTATGYYDADEESIVSVLYKLSGNKKNSAFLYLLFVLQGFFIPLLLYQVAAIGAGKVSHYTPFVLRLLYPFYLPLERPPGCRIFS
jgi:hypothetical protein